MAQHPNLKPGNLARLHSAAQARGGECLAAEYVGVCAPYRFRCAQGHEWQTPGANVLDGTWCRQCAIELRRGRPQPEAAKRKSSATQLAPDGLLRLRLQAEAQGGTCLAEEYLGVRSKYRFRCREGHEWENSGLNVLRGQWCSLCRREDWRLTLGHAQQAAEARGGLCLSSHYKDCKTKLAWQCDLGHTWQATLASIRHRGSWCPDCANLAKISNRHSKAWQRYAAANTHHLTAAPPEG